MATEVREHEERSHSARYLILIFLVCVATCGVFFSLGFLVGRNERSLHAAPSTEVVTSPPVIPPTVNPPAESAPVTPQESAAGHAPLNPAPESVVIPPGGAGANPAAPAATPVEGAPPKEQPQTAAKPGSNLPSPPTPAAGEVGEGITLQVAALRTKQDAEAVVDILKAKGYPVFLVTPEYAHVDDNLFRVQVGPFKTRDDAVKVRTKLEQDGFKPFIRH
ncbi:MAG: SPOR domain-containing protein [Terriglobia bacterium]